MARPDEGLRSDMLREALEEALRTGADGRLWALLARHGGLPSARPSLKLAAAFGREVSGHGVSALPLVLRMARHPAREEDAMSFVPVAGAFALAELAPRLDRPEVGAALLALATHDLSAVRMGVTAALGARDPDWLVKRGADWLDASSIDERFAGSATLLDALADKNVLAKLGDARPLLDYLDRVIDAIAGAPRSAERSPARRRVLVALACSLPHVVGSTREGVEWLRAHCERQEHEDLREAFERALDGLRSSSVGQAEIATLHAALDASQKPLRDPTRSNREARGRGRKAKRRG